MRFIFTFAVSSVLLVLAACGGTSDTPTPQGPATPKPTAAVPTIVVPTLPAGWTPYSRSTYHIALPDSWQEVKLGADELERAITDAQTNNPPLAEQLHALLESGQAGAFAFYAVEQGSGATPRNVSIARLSLTGTNDLTTYARTYAERLPEVVRGAQIVEVQVPLVVNGMKSAQLIYDISLVDGAGNLTTLRGVQYLYQTDSGDTYAVTITGNAQEAEKLMPLARQIGTSFVGITR